MAMISRTVKVVDVILLIMLDYLPKQILEDQRDSLSGWVPQSSHSKETPLRIELGIGSKYHQVCVAQNQKKRTTETKRDFDIYFNTD